MRGHRTDGSVPVRGTVAAAALVLALALPSLAFGQATRTWVSGGGDDVNPCSFTAPCKTWAGAISKTAAGGVINALDSGGFGAVTITKAITLSGTGVTASILASGVAGITINMPALVPPATTPDPDTQRVTLQGLDIQGINQATGNTPGTIGVRILRAGRVTIEDSTIEAFAQSGIDFESTSPNAQLTIDNSQIYNNTGAGLFIAPLGTGTSPSAILTNDKVDGNGCGLVASTLGSGAFTNLGCGAGTAAPAGSAKIGSTNTSITNNAGSGVMSDGAGASNTLGRDLITGNGTGLKPLNSGTILSLGQNELYGNGTDGAPTSVSNQEQGPAGQTGAVGPAGQPGPTGARGPAGAAGQIRLVTCKTVTVTVKKKGKKHKVHRQKCTSKLVSGTASFTTARSAKIASATLTRKGQVYATGRARITATGTRVVFNHRSRLAAGSYQLILRRGHKVIARRTFLVR